MLDKTNKKLEVFEDFIIDRDLPKYKKSTTTNVGFFTDSNNFVAIGTNMMISASKDSKFIFPLTKLFSRFIPLFRKRITVGDFFKSIKNNSEELKIIQKRVNGYEQLLETAKASGQIALMEEIEDSLEIIRQETQLISRGLTKIITEEQVIKFYKQSPKGIRLDWIKNFKRLIPREIIERKRDLDSKGIFDNYLIMHYDPTASAYGKTKKEKDPILFGVLKDSRKLYFIGDWTDEVCDLTMDKLVEVFGEDAIKQNDLNSIIYNNINTEKTVL